MERVDYGRSAAWIGEGTWGAGHQRSGKVCGSEQEMTCELKKLCVGSTGWRGSVGVCKKCQMSQGSHTSYRGHESSKMQETWVGQCGRWLPSSLFIPPSFPSFSAGKYVAADGQGREWKIVRVAGKLSQNVQYEHQMTTAAAWQHWSSHNFLRFHSLVSHGPWDFEGSLEATQNGLLTLFSVYNTLFASYCFLN